MFKLRMSEDERAMLAVVAEHTGLSAADIVRLGIRRQFSELPKNVQTKKK